MQNFHASSSSSRSGHPSGYNATQPQYNAADPRTYPHYAGSGCVPGQAPRSSNLHYLLNAEPVAPTGAHPSYYTPRAQVQPAGGSSYDYDDDSSDEGLSGPQSDAWRQHAAGSSTDSQCRLCPYRGRRSSVKRHIEAVHLDLRPHQCPMCGKRCTQKASLDRHVNVKHTGATPCRCDYSGCSAAFGDPAQLVRHKQGVHNHVPRSRAHHA